MIEIQFLVIVLLILCVQVQVLLYVSFYNIFFSRFSSSLIYRLCLVWLFIHRVFTYFEYHAESLPSLPEAIYFFRVQLKFRLLVAAAENTQKCSQKLEKKTKKGNKLSK